MDINLDPELVLKNPALWDSKTLAWAKAQLDQQAAWDEYEEDGQMDLEDQLDAAFARVDAQKQK